MIIAASVDEVRGALAPSRKSGVPIGFVPTMGFLHEGHLSLIDLARERGAGFIVVSIFVNPLQFGPSEDFETYPRDQERDTAMLEARGVDLLFLPSVETMYPPGSVTRVVMSRGPSRPLEGERRGGHFDGVSTVVLKLFNIVQPDIAVFGQKDAQQCAVIQRLVQDLDLPIEIVIGETAREQDGLAMSSRNAYLSPQQRSIAPRFHQALEAGAFALSAGAGLAEVEKAMVAKIAAEPGIQLDYLRLVDPKTFEAPEDLDRDLLLVGAVRVGATRLIDNIPLPRSERSGPSPLASATATEDAG